MAILPIIAGIGALVGGGMQVVSAIQQGNAAKDAAEYNATVADQNATLSRQQASEDERSFRVSMRKQLGDIRSGYSASGVSIEGSALDVLEESAATGELDALKIKHGGEVKAAGFGNEADLSRRKGSAAQTGGYLSAAGTLLKTGSDFYRNRKDFGID